MILGASSLQCPGITLAKEMGLYTVVVDMEPNAPGFAYADKKVLVSTIDIPAVIEAAKKHKVDGVMTLASDMPMRTVAAVAKELGLVGIDEDTALRTTNKAIMRQALKENGVPVPKFVKVSNIEEYACAVAEFDCAFIVKPADNSGSRGVFKIEDIFDSQAIAQAYEYSRRFSRNGDVVVEEYMAGPEVSVETLTVDGQCYVLQITDKLTTGAPHFVEMGHSQPTKHSSVVAQQIREVAIAANRAVGITNGPSHTEIIITKDGPKIVELGARLGGDCITSHLVPLSTGINMVECCIKIALGETPDIHAKCSKGAAIRYFQQTAGTIKEITGIDEAMMFEGVKQLSILRGVGDKITEIEDSTARMGFVIAEGSDVDDAIGICEKALKTVSVTIIE